MKLNFVVEDGDFFSLDVPEDEKVSRYNFVFNNF